MKTSILHTNDFHGKLDLATVERLLALRESCEFYFDCGDAVKVGNIGIPVSPDPVWGHFRSLDCTASVPGNREFHVSESGFRAKLRGLEHPMVCANLNWKGVPRKSLYGDQETPFPKTLIVRDAGIFGLMVPMVTEKMAARHISAFLNSSPFEAADEAVAQLRDQCKLVICLSHLGLKADRELAIKVKGIDVILGGHSHNTIEVPEKIGNTWVCQTGSYARFAGVYEMDNKNGQWGIESARLEPIR